jgi:hypothetical protein
MSTHRTSLDIDAPHPVHPDPEAIAMVDRVVRDVEAGTLTMRHKYGCSCVWPDGFRMACIRLTDASRS